MKVIIGTSNVPTTIAIFNILFVTLGILLTPSPPQFAYTQTVENEIIENTLETVEEATEEGNTLETVEKATPNSLEITEPFQLENITTNLNNDTTESAITTEDIIQGTEEALEQANNEPVGGQTVGENKTSNSLRQEKDEKVKLSWRNYTDGYQGFIIEYPSNWIANNYSRIENTSQTFEYAVYPATYNSYKVLTRISAIDTVVNYDSNYDDRIILEKPNMTKYDIDGEKAGSYSYLQQDKDSFLQGNEVEEVITIHNGKEYHFTFNEKDVKFFLTDFPKIKKHMIDSIKWLN